MSVHFSEILPRQIKVSESRLDAFPEVWNLVKAQAHHFSASWRLIKKNILSAVGITHSKWVVNNLIDFSTELIQALVTSSIRIILPAENTRINVFSDRAKQFYLPALLFHFKWQTNPNFTKYTVMLLRNEWMNHSWKVSEFSKEVNWKFSQYQLIVSISW